MHGLVVETIISGIYSGIWLNKECVSVLWVDYNDDDKTTQWKKSFESFQNFYLEYREHFHIFFSTERIKGDGKNFYNNN